MSGSGLTCAVIGCHNNSRKLKMWKKSVCALHSPQFKEDCPCCVPYGVHRFPGRAEDEDIRKMWIKNVHRKDFAPKQVFKGVCGVHFPDGRPTQEHPYPIIWDMNIVKHHHVEDHPQRDVSSPQQRDLD
ncbi:uncharacterized protein si:ch211-113p18.3 [Engraulis encrasicolus]|uniref:uncharacterized protein si:ch211-113p18.3 n=1 Tax=Engraulis encrasicolus TaxID=184585 RepID=UPI002FD06EE0